MIGKLIRNKNVKASAKMIVEGGYMYASAVVFPAIVVIHVTRNKRMTQTFLEIVFLIAYVYLFLDINNYRLQNS